MMTEEGATARSRDTPDIDTTSVQHGSSRSRRVLGGVASSIASRGVAAIAPLLLIPLTLSYLGSELYGLWVSILALTSMALWADLGLGNVLLTQLTPALTAGDSRTARRLVSTGYAGLLVVSSLAIVALALLSWTLPWSSFLSIDSQATASKAPTIALITIGGFLMNIPLSLIQRVQYANQQVSQSNLWQAAASVLSVAAAWAAVTAGLSIYWVIGAVAAGPLIGNVVNSWWFYGRNPDLIPRLRDADRGSARSMFRLGSQFFFISVMSSIALNADNLIIAHTLGLRAVAEYSIPYRALAALGLLVTLINLPLWPANGEALAQGDIEWVRHITRRMTSLSALAVLVPGTAIVLGVDPIFRLWLRGAHAPPSQLLVALITVWWICMAAASPRFMVQNSAGLVRFQVRGWAVFFVLSIPLKFVGAQHFGLNGVVAAGIASYLLTMWPTAIIGYRAAINSRTAIAKEASQ
jgi:O-antigen/teichoic acid export membrane protein